MRALENQPMQKRKHRRWRVILLQVYHRKTRSRPWPNEKLFGFFVSKSNSICRRAKSSSSVQRGKYQMKLKNKFHAFPLGRCWIHV